MTGTVLITGGLGYLGGRISRFLAENSEFDLRLAVNRQRHELPSWLKNGTLVHLDLLSVDPLDAVCRNVKSIVHLAAVNEIESADNPEKALLVNGLGTLKLLRAAERAGVERFIYFSTAHVYGAPLAGRISENTLPRPVHPYAITHRTAEDFVISSRCRKKLAGIVLRLSNGFGAPATTDADRWTLLVNDLCRQAVRDGKLVLHSSGEQQRDFITLGNTCRCVQHFLELSLPPGDDGVFNVGSGFAMSVLEMAQRVADRYAAIFGARIPVERPTNAAGDSATSLDYCIEKLKSTGFQLAGNMDDEIDSTLQFCSKHFRAEK